MAGASAASKGPDHRPDALTPNKRLIPGRVELEETKAQLKTTSANSAHQIGELREAVQWLVNEVQRVREDDAHEREKLELRLEVQRLRTLLSPAAGMPPPGPPGA